MGKENGAGPIEPVAGESEETETGGEGEGESPDKAGEEAQDGEAERTGDADPDGGAEGGKDGEAGGEDAGAAESKEGDDDAPLTFTKSQFQEEVTKAVQAQLAAAKPQDAAPAAKELTEEEWVTKESEWGMPRTAIRQVGTVAMKVYDAVTQMLDERLGKFERGNVLDTLAREPGFSDVKTLQPGIDQYMKEMQVPPKLQSDVRILKAAAIYARGLGMSKRVEKARNEGERNRKISGVARPAAPGNASKKPGPGLTAAQKAAARYHPDGEEGYRRDLAARGKPIAA